MSNTVSAFLHTALLWLSPGQAMDDPYVGFFVGDLDGRH
jgi:hypothetical protein